MRRFIETQCIWCSEDIYNDETVHYAAGGNIEIRSYSTGNASLSNLPIPC